MTDNAAADLIGDLFLALARRDLAEIAALFDDDAVLFDPHYPQMEMRGRSAIDRGLTWGLGSIEEFGFTIVQQFGSDDGTSAMVEVDTHHTLKGGKRLEFPQTFVIEARGGLIVALRAYQPYRPHGVPGVAIRISHLVERVGTYAGRAIRSKR